MKMTKISVNALWAEYCAKGSEKAFSELVRQYTNLVYSVARRRLTDSHLAEDVVQTVFMRLATTKPNVRSEIELVGWLHRTTLHVAIDAWRRETRRQNREQQAYAMEVDTNTPDPWAQIAPVLDDAIDDLAVSDRMPLLLRFFERKSMREVGTALGISEAAAKMRVGRALDRLRGCLSARGAICGTTTLTMLMIERSTLAAPSHLVAQLASTHFVIAGSAGAFSVINLATQVFIFMTKSKFAALLGICVIGLASVGIYSLYNLRTGNKFAPSITKKTSVLRGKPGINNSSDPGIAAAATPEDLELLKAELRALLEHPEPSRSYPPLELESLLRRFGNFWPEAITIMGERLASPDYETRLWSLMGMRNLLCDKASMFMMGRAPELGELLAKARAEVQPKLAAIFRSESEPPLLRRAAFDSLVLYYSIGEKTAQQTLPALDPETLAAISATLQSGVKGSVAFRFELVDALLTESLTMPLLEGEFLKGAVSPLLEKGTARQRLLAAYTLASLPGEKPASVKQVLTEQLTSPDPYRYRAARALGRLGADAQDAVPNLLSFAEEHSGFGSDHYAQEALEAACRIQPELRSRYPKIDAKLKREEEQITAAAPTIVTRSWTFSQIAENLTDPKEREGFLDPIKTQIQTARDPEATRDLMLNMLKSVLEKVPESNREAVQTALEEIRSLPVEMPDNSPLPPPSMRSAIGQARVALLEQNNPNHSKLQVLLGRWDQQSRLHPEEDVMTPERFSQLSEGIKGIDPKFHDAWRKQLLLHMPNLDRVINWK